MASTTFIDNQTTIFADWLNDANNAVYNGVFVSPTITATSMVCTGTASGAGFTNLINNVFSSPGAIGSAVPNTGAFTTLSATTLSSTTLNTTAITGLTTPLTRAQGGTGLSAAGTSGNVLTSDGTNWTSATNQAIGVGQTYQDVTASRAFATTYTNSTGKPITLNVRCNSGTQCNYAAIVNGVTVNIIKHLASDAVTNAVNCLIIPSGATYSVTASAGTPVNAVWIELR
jgi:hypothetical protein